MKNIARILSLFLIVCMLVPLLGACTSRTRPLNYLKSVLQRSFEQSVGGEMAALVFEALAGGSVSVKLSGGTPLDGITAADATFYFDAENKSMMSDAALTFGDARYDAKLWFSEREAVMSSTAFLGSTTLGVDFGTLKADLEHSIFRNNSGTAYAMPEVGDRTADEINTWVTGFHSLYAALDNIADLLDKHADTFLKCLTEYANYTRYTEKGNTCIYLSVDNSMLSRALRDTWDKAVKDKAFCRRVREVATTYDAMRSAAAGVVSTEWKGVAEAWLGDNAEIEALCARIDNAPAFSVTVTARARTLTGTLQYLDFSHTVGDKKTAFSLDFSAEDAAAFSLQYGGFLRTLELTDTEDSFYHYAADFVYRETDATGMLTERTGSYALDGKRDAFTLSLIEGEHQKLFEGDFTKSSDDFLLSVNSLTVDGEQSDFRFRLAVSAEVKMPDAPTYLNLATVGETRIDPVAARAKETFATYNVHLEKADLSAKKVAEYFLSFFRFQ